MPIFTCINCNKEFEKEHTYGKAPGFCSKECHKTYRREYQVQYRYRAKQQETAKKEISKTKKPKLSIDEVNKLAKERNISYGKMITILEGDLR